MMAQSQSMPRARGWVGAIAAVLLAAAAASSARASALGEPRLAYVDPGSGSFVLQALVAALAAHAEGHPTVLGLDGVAQQGLVAVVAHGVSGQHEVGALRIQGEAEVALADDFKDLLVAHCAGEV